MYGRESPLPWSTSPRRRTAAAGVMSNDDPEPSSARRFSTGFTYAGMDGSSSTSSGGFTNVASGGVGGGHARSGSHGGYSSPIPGGAGGTSIERTNREKVNQIVQAYFAKAAMVILHARVTLPPIYSPKTGTKKVNKWVWRTFIPSNISRVMRKKGNDFVLILGLGSSTSNLMRRTHSEKISDYGVQEILLNQGLLQW